MKSNYSGQGTLIKVISLAVVRMLMEQFADKISLSWLVFAACAILVLLVIAAVVLVQTYRMATSNPVNYLKTE